MAEPERLDVILRRMVQERGGDAGLPADAAKEPEPGPACAVCDDRGFIYPNLPPDHPDHGKAVPCQCRLQQLEATRPERLRRYSNLGPLARFTFDTLDLSERRFPSALRVLFRNAVQACRSFAEEPHGWIVLLGGPASGKTHLAAATTNACLESGHPAYFINVADLLDHLRAAYAPDSPVAFDELFEHVRNAPVLVLDDLGAHKGTSWAQEKLYQLLNSRSQAELPTIITLGAPLEQQDERVRARLSDERLATRYRLDLLMEPPDRFEEAWNLAKIRAMTFQTRRKPANLTLDQERLSEEVWSAAWDFAKNPRGWFVLEGPSGVGKTHIAAAIGAELRQNRMKVLFLVGADLLDALRDAYDPASPAGFGELFEQVRRAPVLILDDLVPDSPSPWAQEKLFQLLNFRYNARFPTIITYVSSKRNQLDQRLLSRMTDRSSGRYFHLILPPFPTSAEEAERRSVAPPGSGRSSRRQPPEQTAMMQG